MFECPCCNLFGSRDFLRPYSVNPQVGGIEEDLIHAYQSDRKRSLFV